MALGDPHALFTIRTNHGLARLFLDDLDAAAGAFCDALAVCRDAGDEDIIDETLLGLAVAHAARGNLESGACLAGAAASHETRERSPVEDIVWSRLTELASQARTHDGAASWYRAATEGAHLTVHDAIDLALGPHRSTPATNLAAADTPR